MPTAKEILDKQFLEMRWRCLSLAADLDRIERAADSADILATDPRIQDLRKGLELLLEAKSNRAQQFLDLFSDHTPPPPRNPKP